ncbi:Hypothetical_protein [Hexamita inflata]|uniref:Hypothetical_protein n=1 Tax=Hexamita inflata TaxID=28002 RepID=A0AA86Q3Q9_9EUKA|nr:Hypothetical protein HINF_LOCUS36788 [Hexamita inflata]
MYKKTGEVTVQLLNQLQLYRQLKQMNKYGKVSQVHQVPSLTNSTRENEQFICHFMWFSDILRYLTNRTELMTKRPNLITNKYQNLKHLIKAIQSQFYQSFVNIQLKSLINNSLNNNSIIFYELILKTSKTYKLNCFLQIVASKSIIIIVFSQILRFLIIIKQGVVRNYQIKRIKQIKQMNYIGYHKQNKVVGKQDQTRYLTNKLWKSIVYSSFELCSICETRYLVYL